MKIYPKVSIVTPSFNQGDFLRQTIQCVLDQNYPNLEFIIIDGGSTDNTLDVIHEFASNISYWVSEPDDGQSHAINKGFANATGDIHYWLCSDDLLEKGALQYIVDQLQNKEGPQWLVGAANLITKKGVIKGVRTPDIINEDTFLGWANNWIPTQSTFWNKEMWEAAGPFDEGLHYVMDLALWEKMFRVTPPIITDKVLGRYRFHNEAKSISHMDESKIERTAYITKLIDKKIRLFLKQNNNEEVDKFIHDYGKLLEEASDYKAALEEVNHHWFFGKLMNIWRSLVYPRFGKI